MNDWWLSFGRWGKCDRYNNYKYGKYDKDDWNGKFDSRDNGWEKESNRNWRDRDIYCDGYCWDCCVGDRGGR